VRLVIVPLVDQKLVAVRLVEEALVKVAVVAVKLFAVTSPLGAMEKTEEVDERRFNMGTNLGITADDMLGFLNDSKITMRDLWPYQYPKRADLAAIGCRSICLGSYIPWDVKKHVQVIEKELNWQQYLWI